MTWVLEASTLSPPPPKKYMYWLYKTLENKIGWAGFLSLILFFFFKLYEWYILKVKDITKLLIELMW